MSDKPKVVVIFRRDRDGEIVAVFPECPGTDEHDFTVYAHQGQHSSGRYAWYVTTAAAKPAEYASLLAELQKIYDDCELVIRRRMTYRHQLIRRKELRGEAAQHA